MIIKYKILLATIAILSLVSCKKVLDINIDPNNPGLTEGTPKLVLPVAIASSAGRIGGEMAIIGGIWAQYYTQNTTSNQFKEIDAFDLTNSDYNENWRDLYAGALNDLNFVITKSAESGNWNYFLMGTTIKAYTFQVLVDLYDKVPYSQAFQGAANIQPQFDDGYVIYKGILDELDSALSKNFSLSTNVNPGMTDMIFPRADASWTIDPWIQFANTVKLKIYTRMVYAKPAEAEAGIRKLYNEGANFLTQRASMATFINAPDKSNPLYEYNFRKLNTDANLKASRTFLTFLQNSSDPRLNNYFLTRTGSSTEYLGINQGDFQNLDPALGTTSKPNLLATDPFDFISLAESNFLQAEALERFYAGAGAKAKYDAGVNASFTLYGDNATSFLATGGAYAYPAAATFEQKLEAIIVQKWASMPGSHSLEAFFEKNRTTYPRTSTVYSTNAAYIPGQLVYPKNAVTGGSFAKRMLFPDTERSKNSNTPAEVPITTKVWWDVR